MSGATTDRRPAQIFFREDARGRTSQATFTKLADGRATLRRLPVFKAGTFVDANGWEATYTLDDIALIASNFHALQAVFPDVPFRADHGRSVNDIVGYITNVYADGPTLYADMDFTEPDAADKWERGTYRSRSAEIGFYDTNDGQINYPVLLGVAFVDIPAVEGLFSKNTGDPNGSPRYFTEAPKPMNTNPTTITVNGTDTAPALRPPDQTVKVELQVNGGESANHATETKPLTFSFGGKTLTTDEVQAELDKIAVFQQEQLDAARTGFARSLVETNKLAAPQMDAMAELAKSLDPDQFAKLQAVYAGAPVLSILENHIDGVTNADGAKGQPTAEEQEIARLEGIVAFHRRSGMDLKVLEERDSYKQLQALKARVGK